MKLPKHKHMSLSYSVNEVNVALVVLAKSDNLLCVCTHSYFNLHIISLVQF